MGENGRGIAENRGRDIAIANLRAEMREEKEKERIDICAQLDEAHRENVRLRQTIESQSEEASTVQRKLDDAMAKSERWQQEYEKANEEMKHIMEDNKRLKEDLEALTNELFVTRDELDFANS